MLGATDDASKPPALRVRSGDIVEIQTLVAGVGPAQLEEAGLPSDQVEPSLRQIFQQVTDKGPGAILLTGPIFVEDARPGEVLEVGEFSRSGWRFLGLLIASGQASDFCLDDFPYTRSKLIPLNKKRMSAHFANGIDIPFKPFFGSIGVAPPKCQGGSAVGLRGFTGAIWITRSSWPVQRCFFSIHATGTLISCGDGHGGKAMARST